MIKLNTIGVFEALNTLAIVCHHVSVEKGFYDDNPAEDIFIERTCNNIHNEVSELHEAWRNNKLHAPCDKAPKMEKLGVKPLTCMEEEIIDIIYRALDTAEHLNIDVAKCFFSKYMYNQTRKYKHGNKRS